MDADSLSTSKSNSKSITLLVSAALILLSHLLAELSNGSLASKFDNY